MEELATIPAPAASRRRLLGIGGIVLGATALGGVALAALWRSGGALPHRERAQLLRRAGLPDDFPVHPDARRASQPSQGGMTYTLVEPVPVVLAWQRTSLVQSGYEVFDADVPGQDEYLPRLLYFRGDNGTSGAIFIRQAERSFGQLTEVKILSRTDDRLIPPTVPAGQTRRAP